MFSRIIENLGDVHAERVLGTISTLGEIANKVKQVVSGILTSSLFHWV
jgi:hypothetical protein